MTSPVRPVRRLARTLVRRADVQALIEMDEADTRDQVLRALRSVSRTRRVPLSDTRVAVAGDSALTIGLAQEWAQTSLAADTWRSGLTEDHALLVVEVGDGTVVGWPGEVSAVEVIQLARERGVPAAAWVTGRAAPSPALVEAADAVFVSDPELAVAGTTPLLPAAQARTQTPEHAPGAQREGDILIRDEQSTTRHAADGSDLDDQAATTLLEALDGTGLHAHRWDLTAEDLPAKDSKLSGQYDVLVDLGRRDPAATWPVLDAISSRTAVVTTAERAARLPEDLQQLVAVAEPHDMRRQSSVLALQGEVRDRQTHRAHRALLAGHTLTDRARTLLEVAGPSPVRGDRTVSVIVPTNRPHELTNVLENVARQERVDAELIIVAHGIDVDEPGLRTRAAELGVEQLTVVPAPGHLTLGSVLNLGLDVASGAYIAKMDDDNYYGPQFLGDLVDAFTFTSAGITGKWAHYVWLRSTDAVVLRFENYEHVYNRLVQGGSIVAKAEVAQDIRFSDIPRAVDSDFLNRAMAAGVQTYSGDRYNFVSIRGDDRLSHTWKVDDLVFMSGAGRVVTYGDPRDLVTV